MEIQAYLEIVKRRWRIAAFVLLVVICLGALGSRLVSPKYQAEATLRMETPIGGSSSSHETAFADRLINTYVQIATSEQLMGELKNKLGVKALPDIQVNLIPNSEIIQILVEGSNPVLATKTANMLAEMLVSYRDSTVSTTDSEELNLLAERRDMLQKQLDQYQQQHNQLVQAYSQTTADMNVLDRTIKLKEADYQSLSNRFELAVVDVLAGRMSAAQRDALAKSIDRLGQDLNSLNGQYKALSIKSDEYQQQITLVRLFIQSSQSAYSTVITQYDAARLVNLRTENAENIVIVSSAVEPSHPSNLSGSFIFGLGVILSIVAGVIAAFVADSLDPRIYSIEQIGRLTSIPVIGRISKYNRKRPIGSDPVIERDYWLLCAQLKTLIQENPAKTILLTSPNRAEGKSIVTYKLATGFAQSGFKVLVVDADMRRGKQHKTFEVKGEHGLEQFLTGEYDSLTGLILKNVHPGIDLIPSLAPCDNALELIQSARMKALLNSVGEYDVVLFDTPAFLAVPDALALTKLVDSVLIVIQSGHTTGSDIQIACQHLTTAGSRILGIVFNQIPVHAHANPYRPKWGQHRRQTKEAVVPSA